MQTYSTFVCANKNLNRVVQSKASVLVLCCVLCALTLLASSLFTLHSSFFIFVFHFSYFLKVQLS